MTPSQTSFSDLRIAMPHGAGGHATRRLVEGLFALAFSNPSLDARGDAAELACGVERLCFTTDSFVVKPLRFPGGSIGELAVNGTLNDLAVSGAEPLALSVAFILEAGLEADVLREEVEAMAHAARRAGVPIVAGDTKVVEHGKADGLYITTSGVGRLDARARLGPGRVRPGDAVLVSGPIGDHGVTILLARGEVDLESDVCSDTRCVLPMTRALIAALGDGLRWMRDATRGGVATVLNELARDASLNVTLREETIPVRDVVRGAAELLGIDPLHVANEGQFVAVVDGALAELALETLRHAPGGAQAAIIGEVRATPAATVLGRSAFGGSRVIDMLVGDPLPRIC
ncbi:MAG: hydrogenase expression/formation protein HypE [Planctomycetota bacterium]|nr:hydrogenase expression/formation protein HypE [Planctomycetota bacterium]